MEKVLEDFALKLSTEADDVKQYRLSQYKMQINSDCDQETRRKLYLMHQKSCREDQIDSRRGILDLIKAVENHEEEANKLYKPSHRVPGFVKNKENLTDRLMLSEWMIEPPEDFYENWVALACPKGMRVLLVATQGITKTYGKTGHLHKCWFSKIPGGNKEPGEHNKCTILDCIWNEATKSIYILDVLMWVNQTFTDCDMDFRDTWLKCKYYEDSSFSKVSENNEYSIFLIQKISCDKNSLAQFMQSWPAFPDNNPQIDGFLFYHKQSHYIEGKTPLVVWLYPYMINEVLGNHIAVHENYNRMKPQNYVDQKTFIKEFDEKQALKRKYHGKFGNRFYNASMQNQKEYKSVFNSSNESDKLMVFGSNSEDSLELPNKTKKKYNKKKNQHKRKTHDDSMELESNTSINEGESSMIFEFPGDVCNKNKSLNKSNVCVSTDFDSAVSSMDDSYEQKNNV